MKHLRLTTGLMIFIALTLFSCNKSKQTGNTTSKTTDSKGTIISGKIAYVEIDTIMNHYQMAKDMSSALEEKQKRLDADFNNKSKTWQSGVLVFQNKVQKGLITSANAQELQQQLESQQQGLYQLRDQYRMQLAEDNQVNQRQIVQSIMEYLKDYNKEKGYQYILANQFPSSILFADSTLNITQEVLVGLNQRYKKK
jgi:outer membrane protein